MKYKKERKKEREKYIREGKRGRQTGSQKDKKERQQINRLNVKKFDKQIW